MIEGRLHNFTRKCPRFADAEAADGVSVEADFNRALGGFFAQSVVHAALDDAEESLGTVASCRLPVARALAFLMALPRHLALVLGKILLAAVGPAERHLHGVANAFAVSWVLSTFVKCHDD